LTTLALRSSSARSGLFNGIQRIRRSAPLTVRSKLREILASAQLEDDWRKPIAETGHPVLKKVLGYIPRDGSDEAAKKFGLFTPDSSEEAKEKEPEDKKFGLFTCDADSLSVFPRQVNEHPKSKVNIFFLSVFCLFS
jgi:alanyl-tRNA synthetase